MGLIFGFLLETGTLVVENWEQLYSIGSFSFIALWTVFGMALGIMTGGVVAILVASSLDHRSSTNSSTSKRAEPKKEH